MKVFYPNECAKEIVKVLERHNVTIFDMDKVLEMAKGMAYESTHVQSDAERTAAIETIPSIPQIGRGVKRVEPLRDYTKIAVETDEENPIAIAEITSEEINVADGYRVRLTPAYEPGISDRKRVEKEVGLNPLKQ